MGKNRTATIEFDYVVQVQVIKPSKQKKNWNDRIKVTASGPDEAKKNAMYYCLQRGWSLKAITQIICKAVAFAFWDDTYEFLTDEELLNFTKFKQ